MNRGFRLLAGVAVVALLTTVGASASAGGASPVSMPRHGPPDQLLGLKVQKEDVAKVLASESRPLYVDRVGLYSYREPSKLLQGTLQIARFRGMAPWQSTDFQLSIVGHLGGSVPVVVRVGGVPVYITTSKGLVLAIWFKDGYMLALSIRRTYSQPKEMLRQSLAINP